MFWFANKQSIFSFSTLYGAVSSRYGTDSGLLSSPFIEFKPPEKAFDKLFNYLAHLIFTEEYVKNNKHIIKDLLEKYLSKITYGDTLLKQLGAIYRHDTVDRLNLIKAETLVMTGTSDKLVNPECSEILTENITNANLVKIPDAEHGFNFEQPDIFNKNILDFLLEK